jgi:hypothetical protein
MTRGAIAEYAAAVRERYRAAGQREKGQILDEFCRTAHAALGHGRFTRARRRLRDWRTRDESRVHPSALGVRQRFG